MQNSELQQWKALVIRFIKFGIVGTTGVVVNLGVYGLLTRVLGLYATLEGRYFSYALSVEVSILSNFFLNDLWTFRDRRDRVPWLSRLKRFHVVSIVGAIINWGVFALLNYLFVVMEASILGDLHFGPIHGNFDDVLAAMIGILCAMFWNFFANLLWTWKS